jgi:SEC-C motif
MVVSKSAACTPANEALEELRSFRDSLFSEVEHPTQWPDPSVTLVLESRRDSAYRTFKHIHEHCWCQRQNFCSASRIKLLYLIDAYLSLVQNQNVLALYGVSRSMLELNAFLYEVRTKLIGAAGYAEATWVQDGEKFFGTLIRARFGTARDDFKINLQELGVPEDQIKPFHIMGCIRDLSKEVGYEDAMSRYEWLCDFVHHNFASVTKATAGTGLGQIAHLSTGDTMVTPLSDGMLITQYEYPVPKKKFEVTLEETVAGFLEDGRACVRWIDETPPSPYPPEVLERYTGSRDGFRDFRPPIRTPKVGRNDPCPCGSGRKYKYCCGSPSTGGFDLSLPSDRGDHTL